LAGEMDELCAEMPLDFDSLRGGRRFLPKSLVWIFRRLEFPRVMTAVEVSLSFSNLFRFTE